MMDDNTTLEGIQDIIKRKKNMFNANNHRIHQLQMRNERLNQEILHWERQKRELMMVIVRELPQNNPRPDNAPPEYENPDIR